MCMHAPFQLYYCGHDFPIYLCPPYTVEEVVDYSTQLDASVSSLPTASGVPLTDPQTRHPIGFPSPANSPHPIQNSAAQTARPPRPPPKPKRPPELDQPQYIQPGLDSEDGVKDSMYFLLSPTDEKIMEDGPQGAYEEIEYDHEELNRNPPPLWKPPTQPSHSLSLSSTSSIIYSRIEGGKILDHPFTGGASHAASRAHNYTMGEVSKQPKPIPKPKTGKKDGARMNQTKPYPPHKQSGAPVPPTKPKQAPQRGQEKNPLKNILNDPNLMGKLQEKRQELYGAVDAPRASISSCGSDNPMENYEEVCFDLAGNVGSDEEHVSSAFSRVTNMTLPPRRHNIGSEIAMLQCPLEEPKAQEYLSFQPSPSHSPRESTTDLGNGDSHTSLHSLSPRLQSKVTEFKPDLPPRDGQRMRGGSPRLVRKPISAASHHTRPEVPPAPHTRSRQPLKERSTSQEELRKDQSIKSRNLPPRPLSSSFEEPPPVPFRSTSTKDESLPQPHKRRDLSVPLPLPSKTRQPQPPPRQNVHIPNVNYLSDGDCSSPPPPVPTRQTSGYPELQQSFSDDDAPPVPSRGHRQSDMHSAPLLHTNQITNVQAHIPRKTPIRPPREAPADVRVPRTKPMPPPPVSSKPPPVSTKPHKPPVSAKPPVSITRPTKPPVSTKPPISGRVHPRGEITSQAEPQRPLHAFRPVKANHQNGFAPPVPPK